MDIELDLKAIYQVFIAEADELLTEMEEALVDLESDPENDELLHTIFRGAHTIKGSARGLGVDHVPDFAHQLEELLDRLRSKTMRLTPELVTLLLGSIDILREMTATAADEIAEMLPDHLRGLENIRYALEHSQEEIDPSDSGEDQAIEEQGSQIGSNAVAKSGRYRTLRVDMDKLDRMLTLTGEIVIARGRISELLERGGGANQETLIDTHHEADLLYSELQEQVMRMRMVPVAPLFKKYRRTVRDAAAAAGKQVELVIDHHDVEVDTSIIEHIRDPLTHMVRNAIDHGIESAAERKKAGKNPQGLLTLKSWHESGYIVIEFTDDGAGLNRERILARAVERGLAHEGERLSEREILQLIFLPGFSTAVEVSGLSGRGVGMDVVRKNVEALHGTVDVESEEGRGSVFTFRLPLTLAIIDGFGVGIGEDDYIIPLDSVVECIEMPAEEKLKEYARGTLNLRGEILPYLRLRRLFNLRGVSSLRESVVVIEYGGGSAGIVVDQLYGERQAVIKPLDKMFQGLPGISGSTILGNGKVAFILDVPGVMREVKETEEVLRVSASA